MFDEMLWNTALKRLEPYEEKGLDLTPELVEREFYNVSKALRSRIGLQAEKKASKAIEQKKREATENVQSKVMSGYKTEGAAQEARGLIDSNNLTGLLKNWGKYGSLFKK
jgi:predicted ATPase with chaperone activity